MVIHHGRIVARGAEIRAAVDALIDAERGAVGVVGEAGIGKSTLLDGVAAEVASRGFEVRRTRGAAAEVDLPFLGLHDLVGDDLARHGPQLNPTVREALDVALLRAPPTSRGGVDALALNLGVLELVNAMSSDAPLAIVLDDLQWVDRSTIETLRFSLRRTSRAAVRVLSASRPESVGAGQLTPEQPWVLRLGPLDAGEIADMVEQRFGFRMPGRRAEVVHRLTGGNPLLALELVRDNDVDLTSVSSLRDLTVPQQHQAILGSRIAGLSGTGRDALLAAALLSRPTVTEVTNASPVAGLVEAESAGLMTVSGGRVGFTHPLFAGVARQLASAEDRRHMHQRLAEVAEDETERARHLGSATLVPDEDTAAQIENTGDAALERASIATASELVLQAAELTPATDCERRVARFCKAARLLHRGGDNVGAANVVRPLLDELEPGPLRTECLLTLVVVEDENIDGSIERLREALTQPGLDPAAAVEIQLDIVARMSNRFELAEAFEAGRRLEVAAAVVGRPDLVASSHVEQAFVEFAFGVPTEKSRAWQAMLADPADVPVVYSHPDLMRAWDALFRDDHDSAFALLESLIARAEAVPDLYLRDSFRVHLGQVQLRQGDLHSALAGAEEYLWVNATGRDDQFPLAFMAQVLATMGRVDEARQRAQQALAMAQRSSDGILEAECLFVLGFAAVSVGEYDEAAGPLDEISAMLSRVGWGNPNVFPWYPDAVEAYLALDRVDDAVDVVERVSRDAERYGAPTALAMAGRCRGMVLAHAGDLDAAKGQLEGALRLEEQFEVPLEQGRTLLVLGTVQRRRRQKALAREALTRARDLFESIGAAAWAARAEHELERTVAAAAGADLTSAERSIAELAGTGFTNREIAGRLFISEKTVESALTRAYRKLSVRSRTELANHPDLSPDGSGGRD
jgi:DNA-binding CsgD family transcriptional regulator